MVSVGDESFHSCIYGATSLEVHLQLLYHKNGGGGMSRVTKALRNMPEAMTQLLLFQGVLFHDNFIHKQPAAEAAWLCLNTDVAGCLAALPG